MEAKQANNPLHGITLEALLTELVNHYGFETLATFVNIRCFMAVCDARCRLFAIC